MYPLWKYVDAATNKIQHPKCIRYGSMSTLWKYVDAATNKIQHPKCIRYGSMSTQPPTRYNTLNVSVMEVCRRSHQQRYQHPKCIRYGKYVDAATNKIQHPKCIRYGSMSTQPPTRYNTLNVSVMEVCRRSHQQDTTP